jgi:hypothetical protein
MRIQITYKGDTPTRLQVDSPGLGLLPDRELADEEFYAGVTLAQCLEGGCLGEEGCPTCAAASARQEAATAEIAQRQKIGVTIEDLDAPTLEERLEPYGIEWQIEQREREEHR